MPTFKAACFLFIIGQLQDTSFSCADKNGHISEPGFNNFKAGLRPPGTAAALHLRVMIHRDVDSLMSMKISESVIIQLP